MGGRKVTGSELKVFMWYRPEVHGGTSSECEPGGCVGWRSEEMAILKVGHEFCIVVMVCMKVSVLWCT